ncbi:DoxX family protein [Streptomyces iconiensis]|uniref:DoxX family protein n=1 Tax=Streptomyces iconiensis TaxID=1384038 RepID=A0ABT7A7P8_9ACTN|nr:DoxX family protein [Streptomyces iconiensis]MDJ1137355.1 DoxX family protein [Streptomyces iconiensis]
MSSPHATLPTPGADPAAASANRTPDGAASAAPLPYDVGLLVLRLAVGLILAAHGAQKLFGWFGGGGIEGTVGFFTSVGYPSGKTMAVVAGLTETFGGLALVLGLLAPLAGAAVFGTMLNALAVKWGGGFFAPDGVEYELLFIGGAAALTLMGPGRLAVDRLLPVLRTHRLLHGVAALLLGAVVAGAVLLVRS